MKKAIISIAVIIVLIAAALPLALASADTESILDHMVISPETVTLPTYHTQQFAATGLDSGNATVEDVSFTWGIISGGGSITSSGLFTAGDTAGTTIVQVSGEKGGITRIAQATVTVVPGVLDHVVISPKTVTLPVNGTQQFTAVGLDSGNTTVEDVSFAWAVISGSGSITDLGLFKAGNTAGTSIVQVLGEKGGVIRIAQATVTVVVPGVLDHVVISPKHAEIEINKTLQFTALGQDADNVTLAGVIFTWEVITGGGSITASGLFTAANVTGNSVIEVVAKKDGITKTAVATVKVKAPAPDEEEEEEGKTPPGWSHGNKNGWNGGDNPPGWSNGEKEGWGEGDTPPGWSKGDKNGWGGNDSSPNQGKGKMNGHDKD
jgi:hypothetical protein